MREVGLNGGGLDGVGRKQSSFINSTGAMGGEDEEERWEGGGWGGVGKGGG
jgi:hypothetical protein